MWTTTGPATTVWTQLVEQRVQDVLESIELPHEALFSIKPYMIGRDKDGRNANPRVIIYCPLLKTCKEVMSAMQDSESGCLDTLQHSGFGMGYTTLPLEARESSNVRAVRFQLLGDEAGPTSMTKGDKAADIHVFGTLGHQIGRKLRFLHSTDETREATGGPIIRLGNDLYQLTVAHAAQPNTQTSSSDHDQAHSNSYWFQDHSMDGTHVDDDSWDDDELALSIASRSSQGSPTEDDEALWDG